MIMHELHQNGLVSRADLAAATSLNKTTVSSLIQQLIERQFVREVGRNSVGTGRPAVMLELNPAARCIVSAEIGVDFISVACADVVLAQHSMDACVMGGVAVVYQSILAQPSTVVRHV
jgi:predicted ArsR family transcriptional regulator